MKKLIPLLSITLLSSCISVTTPKEKIVGNWISQPNNKMGDILFKESGIVQELEKGKVRFVGQWELTNDTSPVLNISEGNHVEKCPIVTLTNKELIFKCDGSLYYYLKKK